MDNLKRLEELKKLIDDGITRQELLALFEKLGLHILNAEANLAKKNDERTAVVQQEMDKLLTELRQVLEDAKAESDSTFGGIKRRMLNVIDKLFAKSEVNKKLNEKLQASQALIDKVEAKMATIQSGEPGKDGTTPVKGVDYFDGQPGEPGKDADEEKVVQEVLSKIEKPEVNLSDLEALKEELKKEIEEVKATKGRGGVSAMAIANAAKYWVKTEAPSGDIDGVNTSYTVSQPIFAVLAFSLNGEVIPQIPNYTISGKTITFSTALPAAYSGTDFEIKYV